MLDPVDQQSRRGVMLRFNSFHSLCVHGPTHVTGYIMPSLISSSYVSSSLSIVSCLYCSPSFRILLYSSAAFYQVPSHSVSIP